MFLVVTKRRHHRKPTKKYYVFLAIFCLGKQLITWKYWTVVFVWSSEHRLNISGGARPFVKLYVCNWLSFPTGHWLPNGNWYPTYAANKIATDCNTPSAATNVPLSGLEFIGLSRPRQHIENVASLDFTSLKRQTDLLRSFREWSNPYL